ncbi:MAG: FecR domain-containing protein [Elusimicrobiales bacterium]
MRRACFLAVCLAAPPAFADPAQILTVGGKVERRLLEMDAWQPARNSSYLSENGKLRAGADGSAQLEFESGATVWVRPNSLLELEQNQELATRIMLYHGKVKVRLPHLDSATVFEMRMENTVVRGSGAEFVINADDIGRMMLYVVSGDVILSYRVPPRTGKSSFRVSQGLSYEISKPVQQGRLEMLTDEQMRGLLQDWEPNLTSSQRMSDFGMKAVERRRMRAYAAALSANEAAVRSSVSILKERDMAEGRVMTDIHGNLTRVEQQMFRPSRDSMQVISLVQRPDYADFTGNCFAYNNNGNETANRLDSLSMYMTFNKELPQNLSDWGMAFRDSSLHAVSATVLAANQTGISERFVVGGSYNYDAATGRLEDSGNLIFGTLSWDNGMNLFANYAAAAKNNLTFNSGVSDKGTVSSGGSVIRDLVWAQKSGTANPANIEDPSAFYSYQAQQYCIGADCSANGNILWLGTESYLINSKGSLLHSGDMLSGQSLTGLYGDSALETLVYVKANVSGQSGWSAVDTQDKTGWSGYNLNSGHRNIDLVIIPDIAAAAYAQMQPAFENVLK